MNYCEMCELDFCTSTPATTTRLNAYGRAVPLCDVCARVEFDGLPLRKEKPRTVKTKKTKKKAAKA